MTILARLEHWKQQGTLSPQQYAHLASLVRDEPFSLFLELNILLYAGVLAFVAGLGWTVATWSRQLGDVVVLGVLSAILAACLYYCFSRAPAWSAGETTASSPVLDYVLYLGSLVWWVELAYIERRFHILSGQGDAYVLATALLFFLLAYRFDNRFVLSLALSSLAGWLGLTISHLPFGHDEAYREYALVYCLLVGGGAGLLQFRGVKKHFFATYLNIVSLIFLSALLSGVFERAGYAAWFVALLVACGASLAWGLRRHQFAFVAYAAVYGYVGISWMLLRNVTKESAILLYFLLSAMVMLLLLVVAERHVGGSE